MTKKSIKNKGSGASEKPKKNYKPHFRRGKNANAGHPTYIYAKIGDKLHYVGLTHSPVTEDTKNIKLDKNPNPADFSDSYIRPAPGSTETSQVGSRLKNWKLADSDKGKVKSVIKKGKDKKGK